MYIGLGEEELEKSNNFVISLLKCKQREQMVKLLEF